MLRRMCAIAFRASARGGKKISVWAATIELVVEMVEVVEVVVGSGRARCQLTVRRGRRGHLGRLRPVSSVICALAGLGGR